MLITICIIGWEYLLYASDIEWDKSVESSGLGDNQSFSNEAQCFSGDVWNQYLIWSKILAL